MYTKEFLIVLVTLIGLSAGNPLVKEEDNSDAHLLTPELAGKYGYLVESHTITTKDGYILTVHRIPNGKNAPPVPEGGRPVVWLQHGLICSSADWLLLGPERGLAYRLADQGYDVWMGNARGNTYSKAHVTLDPKSIEFWDFSWNEMGVYDVPAYIEYVLAATEKEDIYYIGHSMGTTMFFIAMAEHPELNSKIRLMSAYSPVAFMEHMISPIHFIAPFANSIDWIAQNLGIGELIPHNALMDLLGATVCHQQSLIQEICSSVLFLMCGFDSEQLDMDMFPVIIGHTPAGSSVRNIVHYAQGVNSKVFRKFNHGKEKNLELYGQEEPPHYDISKITAPVAFYWGENDWLGVKSDVYRMAELMPNLVRKYRANHDKFNHMDFLYARDAVTLLYETTEEFMKMF
jgi:lysosomal acid lipase/cholesteryl ester hydrolase